MLYRQCAFLDNEGNKCYGLYNGERKEVICGCCGYVFKNTGEGYPFTLLKTYDWRNLNDVISGE